MEPSYNGVLVIISSLVVVGLGAVVALYFKRRTKTSSDWVVAGRSLPLYVVVFTQFATAMGGGVLVAHVGIAYSAGLSLFWYKAFIIVGFLILAMIAPWLRKQAFSTMPDILRRLYKDHPVVTGLGAIAAITVPFGWLATQFVAFAKLFSEITGLSVPVLVLVMAAISLVFVLPAGLLSVAWTDFVFGVFMVIMSITVAVYAVRMAGGWSGIAEDVPAQLWSLPDGLGAAGGATIVLWLCALLPGTLTNQLYYQRIFATRNERRVRQGLILGGLMGLVSGAYALIIGLSVRAANPGFSDDGEQAAGWLLAQLPSWLLALYAAFLVTTIVSTTGSALQSVVTNLVRDLYERATRGEPSDTKLLSMSKVFTVVVTAVAAGLAILFPTALDWLVASYAYSASALAAPIFLGYVMHKRMQLASSTAIVGMTAGLVGCAAAHAAGTVVPYAIYGITASVVGMLVTQLISSRTAAVPAAKEFEHVEEK